MNRSVAQIEADLTAIWAKSKAIYGTTVSFTLTPRTSYTAPQEADRVTINGWIKTQSSSWDYCVKLDEVTELQDPSNTTYYEADGVHLKAAGEAIAAAKVETDCGL